MPKTESFDISTGADLQEVDNAVNQAKKEIISRFDFKNVLADIEYDRAKAKIDIHTSDDYKLEAIWAVLEQRFNARSVPLKNLKRGNVEPATGSTVRQEVQLTQSIDSDTARKIVKFLKDPKYKKVQSQIQATRCEFPPPVVTSFRP